MLEEDADVIEDIDLNEEKSKDKEKAVKVVGKSLMSLSFCERMRGLSWHRHPLKDRMRDKMVSCIDLLQPGPPSRRDDDTSRLAKRK